MTTEMTGRGTLSTAGVVLCVRCAEREGDPGIPLSEEAPPEAGTASCERCAMPVAAPRRLVHAQRVQRYLRYVGLDARLSTEGGGAVTVRYRDGTWAYAVVAEAGKGFDLRLRSPAGDEVGRATGVPGVHELHARLLAEERAHGRLQRLPTHESGYNPYISVTAV